MMHKKMISRIFFFAIFVFLLCSPSFVMIDARNTSNEKKGHVSKNVRIPRKNGPRPRSTLAVENTQRLVLNVEKFGAKADGETDNSQVFQKVWDTACSSFQSATILVPRYKTYFTKNITFTGPCNSNIFLELRGTIKAFPNMYDTPRGIWILFEDIRNMDIAGGGTIDGNGEVWWKNSCTVKKTQPCQTQSAPTAVTFLRSTNLRMANITLLNAQQMHMNFHDCHDVEASKFTITAPKDSPNTDGIHITKSTNIDILDSVIGTGDDCISIVNGSRNIEVKNVVCGPGHGISIGSLGEANTESHVSDIYVKGVKLTNTTNGLRIKTWQGGRGAAKNVEFEDIEMENVYHPIIIDQFYCDHGKKHSCMKQKEAVEVENIVYRNIKGTSMSRVAINFNCSDSVPCRNILMENVQLKPSPNLKKKTIEAFCSQMTLQIVNRDTLPRCPIS